MTPRQIELARHALGLPNAHRRSYRNRFFASLGHKDYADWLVMVIDGNATCSAAPDHGLWNNDIFAVTLKGARAVLVGRERLCPEDFPGADDKPLRRLLTSITRKGGERTKAKFAGKLVRIWSGEHGAWWRPDCAGYVWDINGAGVYKFEDAWAATFGLGPEKKIAYSTVVP